MSGTEGGKGTGSLGRRLVGSLAMATAMAGLVVVLGNVSLSIVEQRFEDVYVGHVQPVRALKSVSDVYAVDVVDVVHKVNGGRLSREEGVERLEAALTRADVDWDFYRRSPVAVAEAQELEARLMSPARATADRAVELMKAGDGVGLKSLAADELYPSIDPLTERLDTLTTAAINDADRLVQDTRSGMRRWRVVGSLLLLAGALLGLAVGMWFAWRVVDGVRRIRDVVGDVAQGIFEHRVALTGNDELARAGADIDAMIESLHRSTSELAQQAEALERAADEARKANSAKSLFLGSMTHELRTPLNVILGYAQVMRREAGRSAADAEALDRVSEAGEHLLGLIDDVLSVSKVEAGHMEVSPRPFRPRSLATAVHTLLERRADAKGLEFRVEVDASVPDTLVSDERRLRQILVNLITNAIKFTDEGSVVVSVWWQDAELWLRVRDSGRGMSAEEQTKLFGTFFQGAAGRDSAEGTGLGLYISRSLAQAMGGEVEVRSELGLGSEFLVHVQAPASDESTSESKSWLGLPTLPANTEVAPMLVVDDRTTNREVLGRLLRNIGFETHEAADGLQAVEACENDTYCMVWMDIRMPKLDGRQALARIQEFESSARPAPPVVAITASVIDLDEKRAREEGFAGVVNKPFRVEEVVDAIERHLHLELVPPASVGDEERSPTSRDMAKVDLSTLSGAFRASLLDALLSGDTAEAAELARTQGGTVGAYLEGEILGFRHEAVIRTLESQNGTVE